ncbi:hypothetical protein BASA81_003243 [Batrachochytrium salamandrivorans]|nr:hypothetical protein BASA81_003243 [Batrachochytrium salamandrivorans]
MKRPVNSQIRYTMRIQDLESDAVVPVDSFRRVANEYEDHLPKPAPAKSKKKTKAKQMVSPWQLLRFATCYDYFLLVVGTLGGIGTGGSIAAFSILLGTIFDSLNGPDPAQAGEDAYVFMYIAAGTFVSATAQVAAFTSVSERMTIKLRRKYLESVLKQDIGFFDDSALSGSISSQLAENSLLFREAVGEKLGSLFQFTAMFVGGMLVGFFYLWQLCLVILAVGPLLLLSGYFMAKSLSSTVTGQLEAYAAAGQIAEETFTLIRTVTGFALQEKQTAKYDFELNRSAVKQTEQGRSLGWGFGVTMFVYYGSYAIALYVGGWLITQSKVDLAEQFPLAGSPTAFMFPFCQVGGEIPQLCNGGSNATKYFDTEADVCNCPYCGCGCWAEGVTTSRCASGGDVVLTFISVLVGSFAVSQATPSITALTNGRVAAAALYKVIDREPEIDSSNDTQGSKPENIQGEIKFENLVFSYPTRKEMKVFDGLNLTIPAGKRVALVGESGSGKSTIIGLIERYYDPLSGKVTLDGVDLKDINVKHLRSLIGLVSQEPILFGTSIMENVRFGLPTATDEQVIQACKDANADGFISAFPDQYKTFVSSSLVSGGQKQRIAIARALLRNPPILLLDEATAALDNESERLVNLAIDQLLSSSGEQKRTTIVIAHRLSSIKACDVIIVMEKGKVVEQGSHNELMRNPTGLYASLNQLSEGGKSTTVAVEPEMNIQDDGVVPEEEDFPKRRKSRLSIVAKTLLNIDLDDEDNGKAKKPRNYPIRKAFRYAYPERWYFVPAVLAAAANGLTFPLFAMMFAQLLETFFLPNNTEIAASCVVWALAFTGLALGNGIATFFQYFVFGFINGRMTKRVRSALFTHTLKMEIGFFDMKENNVGSLTSKLSSDAALVRAAISDRIALIVSNTSTVVAGFVIAFWGSWKVALVVFSIFPAIVISAVIGLMVMSGMAGGDQSALEQAAQTLSESVNGIRTVTAFNMQPSVQQLYFSQLQGPLKKAQKKGLVGGVGFAISVAVMFFSFTLTFWFGSTLVASREITFKDLNQALFGILMTAMALGQSAAMTPDAAKGQAAVNSVFRTLERKSLINPTDVEGKQSPSALVGDLEFTNIQFAYPSRPNVTVLQNFSLQVKRGQTVAFVGTSGSGKSTLVLLLERFYDPISGSVKIDGIDVRDLSVQWLREQIGIVSQEPALFRGSIMDNIRNGKLDATDEDCINAAKMANVHNFIIKFPNGYDTDLQTAQGVSGGQKQRIAISRALVRNPKILLLDEATSALDEESQRVVQDALDKLLAKSSRTTVVVAHRLSTIRNANVIVVLQQGVVVEQGSFDSLANKPGGAFQSLLRAQNSSH